LRGDGISVPLGTQVAGSGLERKRLGKLWAAQTIWIISGIPGRATTTTTPLSNFTIHTVSLFKYTLPVSHKQTKNHLAAYVRMLENIIIRHGKL
jgi:hypothetical protein